MGERWWGDAQCRVTSFTMFSSFRGQPLVLPSLPPSLLTPLLIDNNKGRPLCIPAPVCPMIVTKSRVIVPCLRSVNNNEDVLCRVLLREQWAVGPALAQPFPMNGSVTGRGAVNINMQYHFKPNHYFCIVILELWWSGPAFGFLTRCVMIVPTFWWFASQDCTGLGTVRYNEILKFSTMPHKSRMSSLSRFLFREIILIPFFYACQE